MHLELFEQYVGLPVTGLHHAQCCTTTDKGRKNLVLSWKQMNLQHPWKFVSSKMVITKVNFHFWFWTRQKFYTPLLDADGEIRPSNSYMLISSKSCLCDRSGRSGLQDWKLSWAASQAFHTHLRKDGRENKPQQEKLCITAVICALTHAFQLEPLPLNSLFWNTQP